MYSLCLRYARDKYDADEIFQNAFLLVFKKLDQLKNPEALSGWIKRIFINAALEFCHKNYQPTNEQIETYKHEGEGASVNEAISNIAMSELTQLIRQLPGQYKKVFNLFVIDGFSHQEISEMLNISIGTSKSNLHDGRRLLKLKIQQLEEGKEASIQKK